MLELIKSTENKLRSLNISKGDKVVIISETSLAYIILICACWKMKVTVVPLSTRYSDQQVYDLINEIRPKLIVSDRELKTENKMEKLNNFINCAGNTFDSVTLDDLHLDNTEIANIIFTSGSTGTSKGIVHTISNHYHSAMGSHNNIPFKAEDTWLLSLPLYHISGLSMIMRALLLKGKLLIPSTNSNIEEYLDQITHISLVPTQLSRLIENHPNIQKLQQLKAILAGGAPMPDALRTFSSERELPVFATYGSSEMSSQITTTSNRDFAEPNCSGKVLPNRELKISDDGEILVKGQTLFPGYFKDGKIINATDEHGWFHTGDIGKLGNDGNLFITGRKDTMFISGGENIYPEEIESAIESFEGVEQAIVVPRPDDKFGYRPMAFIKMKSFENIDKESLREFLKSKLESFKVPDQFFDWPKHLNGSLKPNRAEFQKFSN